MECRFKVDSLSGKGHGYYKVFKNDALVYSDNNKHGHIQKIQNFI